MNILLAGSQVEPILKYVFIGIFVITALLTLASLPNWIKLEEWYRKKLFLALILEVVGIIVMAGTDAFGPKGAPYELPPQPNWIALYENGAVGHPLIKVADSTYQLGKDELKSLPKLKLALNLEQSNELSLLVKSSDGIPLGKVSNQGLFNLLLDIDSPNHYTNIRWEKVNGQWTRVNKTINKTWYTDFLDKEVKFQVYDSPAGTKYRIYNRTDTISPATSTRNIDALYRIIHFCKNSKNEYYLFRITSANLQDSPEFVNILQIQLSPKLELVER